MKKPRYVFCLVLPIRIKGHDVLCTAGKRKSNPRLQRGALTKIDRMAHDYSATSSGFGRGVIG